MPGFMIKRTRIQGMVALATSIFTDLKAAGLTQVLPSGTSPFAPVSGAGKFVMDSSASVNPLHATQPWRLVFELTGASGTGQSAAGQIKIAIANPQQIDAAGNVSTFPGAADATGQRVMGQLGKGYNKGASSLIGDIFMNRSLTNAVYDLGSTMSYILISNARGLGLYIWDEGSDSAPKYSYFFVQSPVDKATGAPLLTDNSPIFVVYSCDTQSPVKFILNEADVFRPSINQPADRDEPNSSAILNSNEQVAIAKGNKYLITFPNRLNTERYAYTEELDLFAYTSADVIAEDSEIAVRVYGEATDRIYRAMKASKPDNAGMRIMMLVSGGGITA